MKPQHPRRPTLRTTPDATAAPRARSSYRYIAGWGEDGALDAIRGYAETIDTIARRLEDALNPASTTQTEHELAHAHGVGYEQYGRQQAEVLVDCVTYCVLGSVRLDVGGESIPYIAGWGEDGALDAIRDYAQTIDTIARRIEGALDPASTTRTENEPLADAA